LPPRPEPTRSLRGNFSWAALGHAANALSQWGIVVWLAKWGSAEQVGQYALAVAITAPVVEFTGLQLHVAQATDTREDFSLGDYLWTRLGTGVLALGVIATLAGFSGYPAAILWSVLTMGIAKVVEGLSLICHGRFQRAEKLKLVARSQLVRAIFGWSIVASIFALSRDLAWAIVGLGLVWMTVLIIHDLPTAFALEHPKRLATYGSWWQTLKPPLLLAILCLPLGFAVGLNALSGNLPRYFVAAYLGEAQLGVFAALAYLGLAARMFYLPLVQTVMPRLAWQYSRHDIPGFIRLLGRIIAVAVAAGSLAILALYFFGRPVISLIYTPEYAERIDVFVLISIGVVCHFLASIFVAALQATRSFLVVLPSYVAANLAMLILLPGLIRWGGLAGAAWAAIAGCLAELSVAAVLTAVRLRRASVEHGDPSAALALAAIDSNES